MIRKFMELAVVMGLVVGLAFSSSASAAPVMGTDGKLHGFTDVSMDGSLWNVEFADDTCSNLFSGCDSPDDFPFGGNLNEQAADFVFSLLASYAPSSIFGCDAADCLVLAPNSFLGGYVMTTGVFIGGRSHGAHTNLPMGRDQSTADRGGFTYAVWSRVDVAEVPEPGTLALAALALAGTAVVTRRRMPTSQSTAALALAAAQGAH